ncbi:hypothetical protein ACFE04_008784 [Oxalis oulophora]
MGGFQSKQKRKHCQKYIRNLSDKIRLLQGEINEMVCEREKETRTYEAEIVVFAFKEAEWKQERQRLNEEVKRLRKTVDEKEDRIQFITTQANSGGNDKISRCICYKEAEQMRQERMWRDEAVEKWKRLYLAIKTELDDLIHRTHRDGLYWRTEEKEMALENLREDIKAKEQTIEGLKTKIAEMEQDGVKKETESSSLRNSDKQFEIKRKGGLLDQYHCNGQSL